MPDPSPRDIGSAERLQAQLDALLPFEAVVKGWRAAGGDAAAALDWTRRQVRAFATLVRQDEGWERLLEIVAGGRELDSWLATDWPVGFDELLLCAPLCQLVGFECARCDIGRRQEGFSCAHPSTVFGRIGPLLQQHDREALLLHLEQVEAMLDAGAGHLWDLRAERTRVVER